MRDYKFFITTFEGRLDVDPEESKIFSRSRCVGYFESLNDAETAVLENWGDIHEHGHYQSALIEAIPEGLYSAGYSKGRRWWFSGYYAADRKWVWIRALEPKWAKNIVGFSIG